MSKKQATKKSTTVKARAKKLNEHYVYVLNDLTDKLFDKENKKFGVKEYIRSLIALFASSSALAFSQARKNVKTTINDDIKAYRDEKQAVLNDILAEIDEEEQAYKLEHKEEVEETSSDNEVNANQEEVSAEVEEESAFNDDNEEHSSYTDTVSGNENDVTQYESNSTSGFGYGQQNY